MAEQTRVTRIEFSELPEFLIRFDQLVIQRASFVVVVPSRPPDDSPFLQRIKLCQPSTASGEKNGTSTESSIKLRARRFTSYFARLRREPDYRSYVAHVKKDCEPLEVHFSPK